MRSLQFIAGKIFVAVLVVLAACNSPYTQGKKTGYYRIEFPERKYQRFEKAGVPYTFEYPVYGAITQDSTYFDNNPENQFWYNVDFPQFSGRIFLSYKAIGGRTLYKVKQPDGNYKDSIGVNVFAKLVNDAYKLTYKNDVVAGSIKDSVMRTPNHVSGIYFRVGGNAATARQFFLSDTSKNFIRGALYFEVSPNADSIKPVVDFLQKDVEHLINTFRWTN